MATPAIFNLCNPNLAAVAMKMAKMLKKMKNTKMIIADYSPNRN
jgi:hypothetical protein